MKNPFKPNGYNAPAPPPIAAVPEHQSSAMNGTYISERDRQFVVKIYDGGKPEDLACALGTLEIAKDIIKNTLSQWHIREKSNKGIIIPEIAGSSRVQ